MIRVIVVEDETLLRQSIVTLMDWESLDCEVVTSCKNGIEASTYLQNNPVDLVITDIKMPGMNGIELCREIREKYQFIEIIILSAYTEFQYAKEALKYQVNDFIVKSEFIEELPKALTRVVEKIKQNSKLSIDAAENAMTPAEMKRNLTKNILEGRLTESTKINDWAIANGLNLEYYCVLLTSFSSLNPKDQEFILRIYQLAFSSNHIYLEWIDKDYLFTIICLEHPPHELFTTQVAHKCQELISTFQSQGAFSVNIAVSNYHQHVSSLALGYQEAYTALESMYKDNRAQFYRTVETKSNLGFPAKKVATQLLDAMKNLDKQALESHLDQVFESIILTTIDFNQRKLELSLLLRTCKSELSFKTLDNLLLSQIEQQFHFQLSETHSTKSLFSLVKTTFFQMMDLKIEHQLSDHHVVVGVRTYIHAHFQQPIKLDDIAAALHFNSSYLSRIYKKQTGEPVIQYLNRYRVEKAKQLIEAKGHKISEIAELVGIEGGSYFSSVFTKIVGISPQQYRKHQ